MFYLPAAYAPDPRSSRALRRLITPVPGPTPHQDPDSRPPRCYHGLARHQSPGVPTMTPDERALIDLRYISSGCARMRNLNFGDDDDAVRERMALYVEWDDAIGQLPKIVAAHERGSLNEATIAKPRSVVQEVTALLPEIERIRFRLPETDALARALRDAAARTA